MPLPERDLISHIRRAVGNRMRRGRPVVIGIGDDASVLRIPKDHEVLVTTDFSLEGVHFRREWHPPESVGHRCLARGLSDIAAMGGGPLAAFLSLAAPAELGQSWIDRFLTGFLALANKFHVELAGGDTAKSPNGILADVVVLGSVPKRRAVLRSGAKPGDRIFVTGELGGSAATLDRFYQAPLKERIPSDYPHHFFPDPRIEVGIALRNKRMATSMIDLSDGLSTDLAHICEESGCAAEIWERAVPRASVGKPPNEADIEFALHGGEDYELLFTAQEKSRVPATIADVQITQIGRMLPGNRSQLIRSDTSKVALEPRGWEHFRS